MADQRGNKVFRHGCCHGGFAKDIALFPAKQGLIAVRGVFIALTHKSQGQQFGGIGYFTRHIHHLRR